MILLSGSNNPLWEKIIEDKTNVRNEYIKYWLQNNLFSLSWFLMLILFIFLWVLWWKKVDKSRLLEIIAYGAITSVIALLIDIIGSEYVLWEYPNDLIPLIAPLFVTDFCMLPIIYMFLYQYFTTKKSFIIAAIIMSVFIEFISERVAVALDIYQLTNWRHIYDFPLYFILAISLKGLLTKIKIKQKNAMIKK